MTEQVTLPHGAIDVIWQVTIGDVAIVTSVFLLIILHLIKWFLGTIWGGRRW